MPTAKPPLAKNKKVLIAVAAVALLVVGYLFLRPKSTAANEPPQTDASGATIPQTGASPEGSSDSASADLLSALAGENQQLMKSFLASSSGLVSLAGSSLGSPSGSSNAGEPSGGGSFGSTTSTPFEAIFASGDTAPPSPSRLDPIANSLTGSAETLSADIARPVEGGPGSYSAAILKDISTPLAPSYSPSTLAAIGAPLDLSNVQSQDYSPNQPYGDSNVWGSGYQGPVVHEDPPTITTHEQTLQPGTGHGNLAE